MVRNATRFTVTDEHLRLLRRAYVSWDETEFGAPEIDCKRPYGNSDMLHAETAVALQIALSTGEFRNGRYTREDGSHGWKRDEAQNL